VRPLGQILRGLLGDRGSRLVGRAYRRLFVDLSKVAEILACEIPKGAHVLDIGGGDGEHLNHLLDVRPDLRVTTIDVAASVGTWIEARHAARVVCMPATDLRRYVALDCPAPDALLISDVVHHIPREQRAAFFAEIAGRLERWPGLRVIIKDVQPGHLRSTLGYLSDRFVTGDDNVSPVPREEIVEMMQHSNQTIHWTETPLFTRDSPNYALVFSR
jgi:hypothetical protein